MMRGLFLPRSAVAGAITFLLFLTRAMEKYIPKNTFVQIFNDPIVVFILFTIAGTLVLSPLMKGIRAIILSIIMVFFITFFVYTYYIVG